MKTTNQVFFTKAELKIEVKKAYGQFLQAARPYGEMRESYHASSKKISKQNRRSASIGFTCHYHSTQKNNHFTKAELAQAWLDIITVTHEMWEEIAEAAAAKVQ